MSRVKIIIARFQNKKILFYKEIAQLKSQKENLLKENMELIDIVADLNAELAAKNDRLSKLELDWNSLDEKYRLSTASAAQQVTELEQKLQAKADEMSKYEAEIRGLQAELEESKELIQGQMATVMHVASLERTNAELAEHVARLTEQLGAFEQSNVKSECNANGLEKEKQNLKNLNKSLLEKVSGLMKELNEARALVSGLEAVKADYEAKLAENSRRNQEAE